MDCFVLFALERYSIMIKVKDSLIYDIFLQLRTIKNEIMLYECFHEMIIKHQSALVLFVEQAV